MGDSSDSHKMAAMCKDADVLIHETTLENEMEEDARSKGHSTPGTHFKTVFTSLGRKI